MSKCFQCGNELKPINKRCSVCLALVDADFSPQGKTGIKAIALVFCIITASTVWYFSGLQSKTQKITAIDLSDMPNHFGDWYKENNSYNTNFGAFSASIGINHQSNGSLLSFVIPSETCTEHENLGRESVLLLNKTPVKFYRSCFSRGWSRYFPATKTEDSVAINIFKESNDVLVENFWFSGNAVFSAIGFTSAYDSLLSKFEKINPQ